MKKALSAVVVAALTATIHAAALQPRGAQLLCHRTANEDVPENTLESLEQAALLGCNVVEIDLRRTRDGRIVLNHDGILERLSDGTGDIGSKDYLELQMLDVGSWMSQRFTGLHIALFDDALRLARDRDIRLVLDIKEKGIGSDVLRIVEREGMLRRVQFNGEWDDVKRLYPAAAGTGEGATWMQPGVTPEQVAEAHAKDKVVVVNFSANDHGMDLAGMRSAIAAGADAINVDYPRLGADAVGRPVEKTLHALILKASNGESASRAAAILELSRYHGFPLQGYFARWLREDDGHVSRVAAEALISLYPQQSVAVVNAAMLAGGPAARANAAWALGMLHAPAPTLIPLLRDRDTAVQKAALLAMARCPGEISADTILPFLENRDPSIRGAAALALAHHQPGLAVKAISEQLRKEMSDERKIYDDRVRRSNPPFTQQEIDAVTTSFKCQMEMMRAIFSISGDDSTRELVSQALRSEKDFSEYNGIVAGFQLWDRRLQDASPLINALGSNNVEIADRAEWILANNNEEVLPFVRKALDSNNSVVRERAIHILAWRADEESLKSLRAIRDANGASADLAIWAIARIESLRPKV